ncbi:MAG: TrkH family potassium uptake protein [Planctomycetota bacterium]|jgi:trk system potassium uptake protein TrkH|nr:TrkH family potassium uptake protein [Planctomycetota bacterium]
MNLGQVARLLAGFTLFFSLAQLIPLAFALYAEERGATAFDPVNGFTASFAIGLAVSLLLWMAGRARRNDDFFRRESLAVVGLAWVVAGSLGALPFEWSGAITNTADALFESISGLTTTGASILGSGDNPKVEDLPQSLLLWRSLLQWIGGVGVIFVFLVLLPTMGVTGKNLLSSEQVGVAAGDLRPRMRDLARMLLKVYLFLTIAEVLLLRLAGMESWFDAICHSFTTISTAGFSTKDSSIAAFDSLGIELVIIVFMFLGGCNFALLFTVISNRFRAPNMPVRVAELRTYIYLVLGLIVAMTLILRLWGFQLPDDVQGGVRDYGSIWQCLRDASFNVMSILTSTGYSSANYETWPKAALILLVFCMFVGACSGSTAGGMKVLRLMVSVKLVTNMLRLFVRPKSVQRVKVGQNVVAEAAITSIAALILMWFIGVAIGTMALALDERLDILSCFTASVSMMMCTGPAITEVTSALAPNNLGGIDLGPAGGYGDLYGWSKILMSFQMILGRLELLVPAAMFLPALWKR